MYLSFVSLWHKEISDLAKPKSGAPGPGYSKPY